MSKQNFCGRTRREFLWESGCGFGGLALTSFLTADGFFNKSATADEHAATGIPKTTGLPAKAKSVIFLFMYGGPSQIDTFDYKPNMIGMDNKTITVKTFGRGGHRNEGRIVEPRWKFKQYGQCGKWVSDLFPELGTCVDDIAFLHSMTADSPIHGSAMLMMNSGKILSGSPSMGSWINYGLGSLNENLPGYVVMLDPKGGPISGAKNWSGGYMPANYQGTILRAKGAPLLDLQPPAGTSRELQRDLIDAIAENNQSHLATRAANSELAARISSYELAFKMQQSAPEVVDLAQEDAATLASYGIGEARTDDFGRRCLMARRLVERGVRFIQLYHRDWDHHGGIAEGIKVNAALTDKASAALITDLKRRGMLDDTLVVWGGEFGRTPMAQGDGRDHHIKGFSMWLAGGGIKGGISHGATDELGYSAVDKPVTIHDLHATMLRQLGIDHTRFTFRYQGRDFRLTDVAGVVVKDILR